ncbi:MAG: hypothetical protein KC777_05100 [Cyanobacteria bacterium HKST-UBA02]|nr:hypothetical protein [Cyanobacteria bacterium HKST-UBA02]
MELKRVDPTIADLAGESGRFIRQHLRMLMKGLFLPCLFYNLCWSGITELLMRDHREIPHLATIVIALSLAIIFFTYEICIRCLAVWFFMTGAETSFKQAVNRARKPATIALFTPTVILELFVVVMLLGYQELAEAAKNSGEEIALVIWLFSLLAFMLPYTCMRFLNQLAVVIVSDGKSPLAGLGTLWLYFKSQPGVFVYAVILFGLIDLLLQVPAMGTSGLLESAGSLLPFLDATVIQVSTTVIDAILSSLVGVVSASFIAAGAGFLYRAMANRNQCSDLLEIVSELETG